MKIKFKICFIFLIIFLMFPIVVKADGVVCVYNKQGDASIKAALHVVNGKPVLDVYRAEAFLRAKIEDTHTKFVPDNSQEFKHKLPDVLMKDSCESLILCQDRDNGNQIWVQNGGTNCAIQMPEYQFSYQMSESEISNLDVATAFSFTGGKGKPNYTSKLTGGCPSDVGVIKLLGMAYNFLKILAPIMLVIFGMIDMAKATTSSDESKMKKAQGAFIKRLIAAVIVFLSFAILELIIKITSNNSDVISCIDTILK